MPSDISAIKRKTERADVLIGILNSHNTRFIGRCKCKVTEEFDASLRKHTFRIVGRPPEIDRLFSVTLGEAVYHLRTSLEHFVHQLAVVEAERAGRAAPKSTQRGFPVFAEEPVSEKHKSRFAGKVQGLSSAAISGITDLQPWKLATPDAKADCALTVLDDLHNGDKHRLLTVVAAGFVIGKLGVGTRQPNTTAHIDHLSSKSFTWFGELQDGAEIGTAFGDAEMKVHLEPSFSIAFPEVGTAKFKHVVPLMQQLLDFVVGTVDALSVHLSP